MEGTINIKKSIAFTEVLAWQKAHKFVLAVYKITRSFPEDERFGLISQFRRAAASITANIAEGYKKISKADKLRFFNIAQGSLEECRNYVILSKDLEFINTYDYENLLYLVENASFFLNKYANGVVVNSAISSE